MLCCVTESERLVPPIQQQSGLAGGVKFKFGNVFFKFARDAHGIYRDDFSAQKVGQCVKALQ